jgi:hypothetical protein
VRALYDGKSVPDAHSAVRQAWASSMAGVMVQQAASGEGNWACSVCYAAWEGKLELHSHAEQSGSYRFPLVNAKKAYLSPRQAVVLVSQYAAAYIGSQPYTCVWNEGYAESETESGLPDRAVRATDGKLYAMDLKTTAMFIAAPWQRSFEHSQQVAMQLDILEATLGEHVEGFILDAVNVKQTPAANSFVRYGPLVYSDALRAELREHRQRLAERANVLAELPGAALKAPSACVRYNELCPYFDLCQSDPADREALVQIGLQRGKLEEREWDAKHRDE